MNSNMPATVYPIALEGCVPDERGLILAEECTFEQWVEAGNKIHTAHDLSQWYLGDWLNEGERAFGEKYSQALDSTEFAMQTLKNAAWVCAGIPHEVRRTRQLSFTHHKLVVKLDITDQNHYLQMAVDNEWTAAELREQLVDDGHITVPPPKTSSDDDGPEVKPKDPKLGLEAIRKALKPFKLKAIADTKTYQEAAAVIDEIKKILEQYGV